MATVSLFLMLGMLGLAVDLGWGYFRREAAQTAADAAASAVIRAAMSTSPTSQACAANQVWCGSPVGTKTNCPATVVSSASSSFDNGCMLAAANGFTTSGGRTVSIQANTTSPAPTVPGTTVTYWATVRVSENVVPFFGAPGGGSALTSGAIATAAIVSSAYVPFNSCLVALSPTAADALNINNGAVVTTSSCGTYVNSNNAQALSVTAKLVTSSAKVVGNYTGTTNGGCIDTPTGGCNSLTPTTGAAAVADPFASLPTLSPAGTCNAGNYTAYQGTPYDLSSGTYCGISLGNGNSAVMGAGTYIINGGVFSIQGGTTLTGTAGVMVYLTNGATVNIANGATVNMTAQSSGTYEGILFYQDKSVASPGASTFAGGANMTLNGSLYFPVGALSFSNGIHSATTAIVASTINIQGGATLNQATSQSQTGLGSGGGSVVSVIQ